MNRNSNTIAFLAVLISQWLYSSTRANTLPPLSCSTSNVSSCDAFIYLRNITEPKDVVASRFHISSDNISEFLGADYLARIRCSCLSFLGRTAFFYRVNYTAQASDKDLLEREISDKYFSYTAWTETQQRSYEVGDRVQLALGCGCPIPGWPYIISYAVPPKGDLIQTTRLFNSDMPTIIRLNNISDPDLIRMNRVYFIPYRNGSKPPYGNPPSSPPTEPGRPPGFQGEGHKAKNKHLVLIVSVTSACAFLLLLLSIVISYYVSRKMTSSPTSAATNGQSEYWVFPSSETMTGKGTEQEERDEMRNGLSLSATTNLTGDEILEMKSFCCQSYEIGEGGFGRVYRGNFRGKDVAIKKIKRRGRDSRKFVENEINLLQGMKHKNLTALIAWCLEERTFYLVYEYVDGCTLDDYLRGNRPGISLNWKACLKIIVGIAEGIQFLHRNRIIHVDIKPQNLMLDNKDDDVKIIDFGLSRNVDWDGTHRSTDRVAGTRGYWAPEYCLNHKISYKHDVYSFGVVVLEVITGEMHVDNARGSSQFHIPQYVKHMMAHNRFEEAVDKRLKEDGWDDCDLRNAMAVAELALKCAENEKDERPDMDYVVREVHNLTNDSTEEQGSEIVN